MITCLINTTRHHSGWVRRDVSEMKARLMAGVEPVSDHSWWARGLEELERRREAEELATMAMEDARRMLTDVRVRMVFQDALDTLKHFDKDIQKKKRKESERFGDAGSLAGPRLAGFRDEFWFGYLDCRETRRYGSCLDCGVP